MNQNPGIRAGSVITDTWPEAKIGYVTWDWVGSDKGGEALYDLDTVPPTITHIRPFYEYLTGAAFSFTLEEVIQHYGEPSHISAYGFPGLHGDGPFYKVTIIYAPQGTSFEQRGLYQTKPILSPAMRFDRVFFHPLPLNPDRYSDVWQGFQSFDAYCRGAPDAGAQSTCPSRQ